MISVILLFSAFFLCSGKGTEEPEYVDIKKGPLQHAGVISSLKAKHNITTLALNSARLLPPKQYDWRVNYKWNVVPEAENQIPCATCWIFAMLYLLETQYAIYNQGRHVSLSKQQVVDCLKGPSGSGGCLGWGTPQMIFDYVKKNGLQGTRSYGKYEGKDGTCRHDRKKNILSVKGNLLTFSGHEAMVHVLFNQGPILATMISPSSYNGGVMKIRGNQCPDRKMINHCVLLVGYGVTKDGLKYWIAKNTYGTGFGIENGYFKIERGRNTLCIEDFGAMAEVVV